ncbi:MAG: restriction endonuclease subunit S [Nitrosomonadaceae bacterium]|nr:restriction endonuclease subunit S [Nitrosomonadaceae bacterium]
MKAGWQTKKLGELLEVQNGYAFSSKDYSDSGHFVMRIGNVQNGYVSLADPKFIKLPADGALERFILSEGDILVSLTGNVGRVGVIQKKHLPAALNQRVARISIRKDSLAIRELLLFFLFSDWFREELTVAGHGAAQQNVSTKDLVEIQIPIPPLHEQQRIVGILDQAFDGIATAKASAEKNLQNARALFESHLQSVFTQRGEGWMEKTFGEVYDVRDGTHDSPKYHATGYPLITSKNLKRKGLSFDDVKLVSKQDYNKINERSAVHKGDVLLAMIGTIGNPTLVEVEPNFAIKNVALFKIPSGQSGAFLKHYLDSGWVISKMVKEAKGTTQKFVGLGYLRGFPINVPLLATQLEVVEKLDDLHAKTQRLESLYQQKLAALEALKKSLLHQAFSGEL